MRAALVTGPSSGIGRVTSLELGRKGSHVVAAGRSEERTSSVIDSIREEGGSAEFLHLGLASLESAREAARTFEASGRPLDVLVNNAGVLSEAPLEDLTDEDLEESLDINLRGTLVCTRATVPHMVARGAGRVISAASMSTRIGAVGLTAYSASKGAIVGMTRTWARELGPKGITANAVAPGLIDSETTSTVPAEELEATLSRLPARRLGRPYEVAAVYVFLASDLSSCINGAGLGVDGGLFLV